MTAEQEKTLRDKIKLVEDGEILWYHKLSAIDDRKIRRHRQASFFGVLGTLCALAQNGVMFTFKVRQSSVLCL
jgi:hypothetical protein